MSHDSKTIIDFYFTSVGPEEDGNFKCKCGVTRTQKKKTGYTNLMSHVNAQHPNYLQELEATNSKDLQTQLKFVDKKSVNIFSWLEWIVMDLIPFSFVEKKLTRKNVKLEPISRSSITKYLLLVSKAVEEKVAQDLPVSFGIVFDGWTDHSTHYVAIFASYSKKNVAEPRNTLLAIAPLLDEESMSASAHKDFLEAVLSFYNTATANIIFITGDNCSINTCFADLLNIPFIGCASHRLNLAVQQFLSNNDSAIEKVHAVMKKLRSVKKSAVLRRSTSLHPVLRNITRWSSTFAMLKRYNELRPILCEINDPEIVDLLPSPAEERTLSKISSDLDLFDSVTVVLQKETIDLFDVRILFDDLIEKYPDTSSYLSPSADIVHCPAFETGISKIVAGKSDTLTDVEKMECVGLLKNREERKQDEVADVAEMSYAEKVLQSKRQRTVIAVHNDYEDLKYINPTSNIVERLFSSCAMVLTDYRQSLLPIHFEAVMYLKVNRQFWDAILVSTVVNAEKDDVEG